jgi:hypothetical protein
MIGWPKLFGMLVSPLVFVSWEWRSGGTRDVTVCFDHMIDVMGAKSGPVSRFDAQARSTALLLYYFAGFHYSSWMCSYILHI